MDEQTDVAGHFRRGQNNPEQPQDSLRQDFELSERTISWLPRTVLFAAILSCGNRCSPPKTIGEIQDRMPLILDERAAKDWMNPREEARYR